MKTIKYFKPLWAILLLIALLISLLTPPAKAETGFSGFGLTNTVFTGSAVVTAFGGSTADLKHQDFCTFFYKGSVLSTNGTTNTLYFAPVDSQGNIDTVKRFVWTVNLPTETQVHAVTATNTFVLSTNLDRALIGSSTQLKLMSNVTLITDGFLTNPVLHAEIKSVR